MSNRSLSLTTAAAAFVLLPFSMQVNEQSILPRPILTSVPVKVVVRVMTATHALNLAALTQDDFGDNDTVR